MSTTNAETLERHALDFPGGRRRGTGAPWAWEGNGVVDKNQGMSDKDGAGQSLPLRPAPNHKQT